MTFRATALNNLLKEPADTGAYYQLPGGPSEILEPLVTLHLQNSNYATCSFAHHAQASVFLKI